VSSTSLRSCRSSGNRITLRKKPSRIATAPRKPAVGKSRRKGLRRWPVYLLILWVGVTVLVVLLLRVVDPPVWAWRIHRDLSPPLEEMPLSRHRWVPLDQISKPMQLSAVAAEDQLFAKHRGFDWRAIVAAIEDNEERERIRGASTITQQAAKNLFLWPSRTWLRKGVEAYFTVLLEALWPKRRILEVYLNIVEFGPNLYGVEAAGLCFYGMSAARITADQAARMAAVLPNPYRYHVDRPSDYVLSRSRWIRRQMRQLGESGLAFRN